MKIIRLILLFLFSLLSLAGCVNHSPGSNNSSIRTPHFSANLSATPDVTRQKLVSQYQEWQGVPYRLGGLSKEGIDCSGFVYLTFLEQFDIHLPRTTSQQKKLGAQIPKSQLTVGDLLFFKTENDKNHVGIYFGDSKFIHASTSSGIKISSLLNSYWSSTFWFARRL